MFNMSDMKKEVGERLRGARERKGYRQNRVAKHLGIHNSTLAKYESGDREADIETLKKIAELYEVSLDWILGHTLNNDQAKNDELDEILSRLSDEKKKLIIEIAKNILDK